MEWDGRDRVSFSRLVRRFPNRSIACCSRLLITLARSSGWRREGQPMQRALLGLCGEARQQPCFESIGEAGGWLAAAPDGKPIRRLQQGVDLW
jgi:hypothetical protein